MSSPALVATAPQRCAVSESHSPGVSQLLHRPRIGQADFHVARNLDEVLEAWSLVYEMYRDTGLIDVNPRSVHFVRQAISSNTAVILARRDGEVTGTISTYTDSVAGLPLDRVYAQELNELRQRGRRLLEVGLLAERREGPARPMREMLMLMGFPFHYARHLGYHDVVIGVHPHHVRFYTHVLGFQVQGPMRTYAVVKDHLVVLLRLDVFGRPNLQPVPKGIRFWLDHPVGHEFFARRFNFDPRQLSGSPIDLGSPRAELATPQAIESRGSRPALALAN